MKKFKEVKVVTEWKKFDDEGDYVEGTLISLGERESMYGLQRYLTFELIGVTEDNLINVGITSGLDNYEFDVYLKKTIRIVYKGYKLNEKTGRKFKDFSVLVEE